MTPQENSAFSIRTMLPDDLKKVIGWTSEEGWNLGLNDPNAFLIGDPTALLVACLDGEPVAAISAMKYDENLGFIGLYIVRSDLRGRGIGFPLWQAGMASLEGRTIGLDAVVAQQANYAHSGFKMAFRTTRYSGVPQRSTPAEPCVQIIGAQLLKHVVDYDKAFFPANREAFLRHWLIEHSAYSVAYVEDGVVKGFGAMRPAENGYKIGPLFADSQREAEAIFGALVIRSDGATMILDVPEPNHAGTLLAQYYGLSPLFETARMYRGHAPGLPLTQIYGMLTLEIG